MTMTRGPIEITLAGERHQVGPLTLDQLQQLLPSFERLANLRGDIEERVKAARAIVSAAMSLPDDQLGKKLVTLGELLAAIAEIYKLTGLAEVSPLATPAALRAHDQ